MNENRMLVAENLAFAYPGSDRLWVWNLAFDRGLTWIKGENGAGKSTLMKVLAGGLTPMAGVLRWQHIDAVREPLKYRRRIFWCGPGPAPFAHLTGYEFVGFMRGLYSTFNTGPLDAHLQGFGLHSFMNERLHRLSTGTQRKVWLTAALLAQTPVVLLDEPLGGLDANSRGYAVHALNAEIQKCASDRIWLTASHEPIGEAGKAATIVRLLTNTGTERTDPPGPMRVGKKILAG